MRTTRSVFATRRRLALALLMVGLPAAPTWKHLRDDDELHGKVHDKMILKGAFLKPPRGPIGRPVSAPLLVVSCAGGQLENAFLSLGAVLDKSSIERKSLDVSLDGKPTFMFGAGLSTDGEAVFLDEVSLRKILMSDRALFGVPQYLGPQIVAAFDMPDAWPVISVCRESLR